MCILTTPQAPPAVEENHHPKQKALENARKRLGWMDAWGERHSAVVCDDDLLPDPTYEMDSELCSELEIPVNSLQMGSVRGQPWKGDALLCSITPAPRHAHGGSSSSVILFAGRFGLAEQSAGVVAGLICSLNTLPSHPETNKPLTRDTSKAYTHLNGSHTGGTFVPLESKKMFFYAKTETPTR